MPAVSLVVMKLTFLLQNNELWAFNSDVFQFQIEQSALRNVYMTSVGQLYGYTYNGKYCIRFGVPGSMILTL